MVLPDGFADGQAVQALDENQQLLAKHDYGVVSGCGVSIYSGNLGSGEATVEVASGTLIVNGSSVDLASNTVTIPESNVDPRKDLVVYDTGTGSLTSVQGTAEDAEPAGAVRQQAEIPTPPSLNGSVESVSSGSDDPFIPLAEAWIPADATSITSDDLFDRRQSVEPGRTIYMSDYVAAADRDGSTAVDSQFDAAIADAEPHDTIVFDNGTYQLSSQHAITKTLTIDGRDSTIRCTNTSNNNPHIAFQGGGTQSSTTTSAATSKADRVIGLNDESIFSAGDRFLIIASAYSSTVNAQFHMDVVESVDSTNSEVTLKGGLSHGFASGVDVYHIGLLDSPTIRNIQTTGGGNRHLQFRWCETPTYDNVSVSNYLEVSLYSLDCWKPRYYNVEATDPKGLASGEGEPIALYRCQDGYIESPRVNDCRRGIDFAWGSHQHTVVDPIIRGVSLNGISTHGNDIAGTITITGGEILCDPNGQSGAGITMSDSSTFFVDGTRIVARENGMICSGESFIHNVKIEPSESAGGAQIAGINVKHGDVRIRDCFIDDPNGDYDFPIWVDGAGTSMSNITIDAEIKNPGGNHVYLDARDGPLDDITVTGILRGLSGTASQGLYIRADGTSVIDGVNVCIKGKGFSNQCVRILSGGTEQITNVNIHDSDFDTGKAAVYTDGSGSFGSIRVTDCNCDTGSTSLSFNETVNKLFVVNNDVSGSIDSTGATNSTVTGNL